MAPSAPDRLLLAGRVAWALLGLAAVTYGALWILARASIVVVPFALALFPAAILTPPARWLEDRGLGRTVSTVAVLLAGLAVLGATITLIVVQVQDQADVLVEQINEGYDRLSDRLADGPFGLPAIDLDQVLTDLRSGVLSPDSTTEEGAGGAEANGTVAAASMTARALGQLAFGLLALFFFVRDGDKIAAWFRGLFPTAVRDDVREVGDGVGDTIGNYIRGQATVAMIDGVLIGLGLFVLGVPLALALGVVTFIASFVPIAGAIAAGLAAALVALASDGLTTALVVTGLVIVVQQLEGNILQPWILGRQVELHPLAIVTLLTLGGFLFGLVGAILAVPLGASVHTVLVHVRRRLDAEDAQERAAGRSPRSTRPDPRSLDSSQPQDHTVAIQVALEHRTTYRYDRLVTLGPQTVRLRPAPHCRTPILSYSLTVEPGDHFVNWQQDAFGNHLARFVFEEPTRLFDIRVDLVADMTTINPFDFFLEEEAEHWPVPYDGQLAHDLAPYLRKDKPGEAFSPWLEKAKKLAKEGERTIDVLVALNQMIMGDVAYSVRMEPGVQTPDETLTRAIGSCRDSGWLFVQAARHLGLAARFASGYLVQLKADQEALDGPSGPEADFTDLHAWAEVYLPGAGWVGLDPTSGLFAGEGHIPLACTPEPSSAAPIDGALSFAEVEFEHANVVTRFHEDPRVTLPYTDGQWTAIDKLGKAIDRRLKKADVRLTMGGEPTFVSVDDRESPEWKIAADGGHKRELAWDLTNRLARKWAKGGIIQSAQGKWYPGEPLPRWQFNVWWRKDGTPIWSDAKLLADPWTEGDATIDDAKAVAEAIAERLGIDGPAHLQPAFEDATQRILDAAKQPYGDPPDESNQTLLEAESDGDPVGFVLPLRHDHEGWVTATWQFRRGRLNLIGGDSPIGLRLPLHSLSWQEPSAEPERSTMEERDKLPSRLRANRKAPPAKVAEVADGSLSSVAVELRDGQVRVFLPPVTHVEDGLELLQVIEEAAAACDRPVVVEGYPLPWDHRLQMISVAPDPGVIEVNIHPLESWTEAKRVTTELYEEARRARLSTETFDLDGLHAGTGGGNHVTLGGATPADSPMLRRPSLLRSMLAYWQHHPSLSYLFSARFIGPTSQFPRVDEGRNDRLHHLDVAFAEVDRLADAEGDDALQPWQVDRLFRNLLTDLTGNTHRSEFCIDKLFSPDSERGRLGLLELRGFEMPPHEQMGLVQLLLVRALALRCWEDPYRESAVRWGTLLHDRFLLPHHVQRDIEDVCRDLADHGIRMDPAWFGPFVEFRFPRIGTTVVDGVTLEVRAGIEPWDVLGEEATAQGTSRFVDSSMERVQVKVNGAVPGRHLVTVNGRLLPLHETGEPGTLIAGVRYRAWHPPSGLHPTIPVHAPLTFDVVDRIAARSLGGARYHVSHPGGRAYDTFPVNAVEAESRRMSRFEQIGHTAGKLDLEALLATAPRTIEPEHPQTLDLRLP